MAIDYTKRPSPPAGQPSPPAGQPSASTGPVVLTKAAPTVSLTKAAGATGGLLRVNLNWNARPARGGFLARFAPPLDLDLGCLYEFSDGTKGVVQALGNAFSARPRDSRERIIWLDGDDRSGAVSTGENLFVDLAQSDRIRRILVFALIYEGAANWAEADGVVTLYPAAGPQVEVRLDEPRDGARICAVALLTPGAGGGVDVRREVKYLDGAQRVLDQTYGWGMNWAAGRK